MLFKRKENFSFIIKHTLFFAMLLPSIQSTQLYILFNLIDPILLVMPVTVGVIVGTIVGYIRLRNTQYITKLKDIEYTLREQVLFQTKELEEKNIILQKMAKTDSLTKLGNRVLMKEVLDAEHTKLSVEYKYITIMMIDIDYFKNYNDFYGHIKGDEVLEIFGKYFLDNSLKYNYEAIRFGGEEFCLILPNCDDSCADKNAKKIIEDIRNINIKHAKSEVADHITVSIGVHTTDKIDNHEECSLLGSADEALYKAKESGRNKYLTL